MNDLNLACFGNSGPNEITVRTTAQWDGDELTWDTEGELGKHSHRLSFAHLTPAQKQEISIFLSRHRQEEWVVFKVQ